MRLLFAGTPEVAVPALEALLAAGFDVVGVLTRPDAPVGRKHLMTASPVAQRAEQLGLPVLKPTKLDAAAQAEISALAPQLAAIVAYGALIPPAALEIPHHGWINLHFSLLPAWRGAAPVQHAVIHGDELTGASTFLLEAGLDTGPVYGTVVEKIRPDDTASQLLERLARSGAVLLSQTVSAIQAGSAVAVPQTGPVSLAPKLSLEDGRIDFQQPGLAISRRIRGVTEQPGAWTTLAGQRFKIGPVTLRPDQRGLTPGELGVLGGKTALVGTGSHAVQLDMVQPSSKTMMPAAAWLRGLGSTEGLRFE